MTGSVRVNRVLLRSLIVSGEVNENCEGVVAVKLRSYPHQCGQSEFSADCLLTFADSAVWSEIPLEPEGKIEDTMAKLHITVACNSYDHVRAIRDGRVDMERCEVSFLDLKLRKLFDGVIERVN